MTPRENFLSCLRRTGFDHIPLDLSLCQSQVEAFQKRFGHTHYHEWFGLDHRSTHLAITPTFHAGSALFPREELPASTVFDEYGVGHSKGSEAAFHMTRMHHPLRGPIEVGEIHDYPLPRVELETENRLTEQVRSLQAAGFAVTCGWECTVWERAWYLRSMEDLMVDMMFEDEKAGVLLDRITDFSEACVARMARAGVDVIRLGDDIGTQRGAMMSLELWRTWLKPRLARVIAAAKAVKPDLLIFYHSCGDCRIFIEDLIEIGVDILNPVQPEAGMDFLEIHRTYGNRISFWGTLGTQQLLPWGSPQDVEKTVQDYLEACGNRGGIVLGPTHLVEPEVPWENLVMMREASRTVGAEVVQVP